MERPRILLPFVDDSTLFFACRMAECLATLPCETKLTFIKGFGSLSDRQMTNHLPQGPAEVLAPEEALDPETLNTDVIVSSRLFRPLLSLLGVSPDGTLGVGHPNRPWIIAFQGGLDFTPQRGLANRLAADGVFLIAQDQIKIYRAMRSELGLPHQDIAQGHPAFLRPDGPPVPSGEAVTFFAQAISPLTRRARMHMVKVLAAMARHKPNRPVRIKLRHLPGENRLHLHKERWDYVSLMDRLQDPPSNLELIAGSMQNALADTGLGLTCTSTAAADLVSARIPTIVHLDYVENYLDPLVEPMADLFKGSGLIKGLNDVLYGNWQAPSEEWLDGMFCDHNLGEQVLAMIGRLSQQSL